MFPTVNDQITRYGDRLAALPKVLEEAGYQAGDARLQMELKEKGQAEPWKIWAIFQYPSNLGWLLLFTDPTGVGVSYARFHDDEEMPSLKVACFEFFQQDAKSGLWASHPDHLGNEIGDVISFMIRNTLDGKIETGQFEYVQPVQAFTDEDMDAVNAGIDLANTEYTRLLEQEEAKKEAKAAAMRAAGRSEREIEYAVEGVSDDKLELAVKAGLSPKLTVAAFRGNARAIRLWESRSGYSIESGLKVADPEEASSAMQLLEMLMGASIGGRGGTRLN